MKNKQAWKGSTHSKAKGSNLEVSIWIASKQSKAQNLFRMASKAREHGMEETKHKRISEQASGEAGSQANKQAL